MQLIRSSLAWSSLLRFSQSQIVTIGTLAVTLVPILAQLLLLYFQFLSLNEPDGDTPPFSQMLSGISFHFLALELYIGGLCLFVGKLIVQIGCPQVISRFPYEDDFVVFSASVRDAQALLDGGEDGNEDLPPLLGAIKLATENAQAHQQYWRARNESRTILRVGIGFLFIIGALGVSYFLGARLFTNAGNAFSVFGA